MTAIEAIKALEDNKKVIVRDGDLLWQVYPDPHRIGRYRVDDLRDPFWQWRESNMKTPLQAFRYIIGLDLPIEEIDLDFEEKVNERNRSCRSIKTRKKCDL